MKQYIVDAFTDKIFHGNQASERGGFMRITLRGDRVLIAGKAVLFAVSELMTEK